MEETNSTRDPQYQQDASPRRPIVLALFSVAGSVGKSQIAMGLYQWRLRKPGVTPPLLVDADLVAGTLSRAAGIKNLLPVPDDSEWTLKTLTSSMLLEKEDEILPHLVQTSGGNPIPRSLLPAAQWVLCEAITESAKLGAATAVARNEFLGLMQAVKASEGLEDALNTAQEQQARFNHDLPGQRRFWRSILSFADKNKRDVIVDLPAQGPSGVAVPRNWAHICNDARKLESHDHGAQRPGEHPREKDNVTLMRALVYTSDDHPLVKQFLNDPASDLLFLQNMVVPPVQTGSGRYHPILLADVGDKAVTPSVHHSLMKKTTDKYSPFDIAVGAVADAIFG